MFDVLTACASIMEVAFNPADQWAWMGLAGDVVDLIPFVTGVGETVKALRAGDKVADSAGNVIYTYRNLKKVSKGSGEEVHHIVEKRFASKTKDAVKSNAYTFKNIIRGIKCDIDIIMEQE